MTEESEHPFKCIKCNYRYKEYPCGMDKQSWPTRCCEKNKKWVYACPDCTIIDGCPQCNYKFQQNYCWQCDEVNDICAQCRDIKDLPCKICNVLTNTHCFCCYRHICIENTLIVCRVKPYNYKKSYSEYKKKLLASIDGPLIRESLICSDCYYYADRQPGDRVKQLKDRYKLQYRVTIKLTLLSALKKYDMHDKLFISYLTSIIANF